MTDIKEIKWHEEPQKHDYPAAEEYLFLIFGKSANNLVKKLKEKQISNFKAKDIFRASALPALDKKNYHVKKNIEKIENNHLLSPILLVRDQMTRKVIIADGYHRLCAVYLYNEDAIIPCQITSLFS